MQTALLPFASFLKHSRCNQNFSADSGSAKMQIKQHPFQYFRLAVLLFPFDKLILNCSFTVYRVIWKILYYCSFIVYRRYSAFSSFVITKIFPKAGNLRRLFRRIYFSIILFILYHIVRFWTSFPSANSDNLSLITQDMLRRHKFERKRFIFIIIFLKLINVCMSVFNLKVFLMLFFRDFYL